LRFEERLGVEIGLCDAGEGMRGVEFWGLGEGERESEECEDGREELHLEGYDPEYDAMCLIVLS
jgi:hypothetical protein